MPKLNAYLVRVRLQVKVNNSRLTAMEIAKRWGRCCGTLSLILSGQRILKVGQLLELCDVLGIDIKELFNRPTTRELVLLSEQQIKKEKKTCYVYTCEECGSEWESSRGYTTCDACEEREGSE